MPDVLMLFIQNYWVLTSMPVDLESLMSLNDKPSNDVLKCADVSVRFPLVPAASRWRLMLGEWNGEFFQALSGIDLSVPEGKVVGVIGHNGAGKSTLLRTLAGIYPLSKGEVVCLGHVSSLFELGGMGGIQITGMQFIIRWLRLNDVPRSEWNDLIRSIRDFSELGERLEDRIYTFSAGMAARLYFSTVTSFSHKIYLIDEVLAVGDEHFQAKCWHRLRERFAEGVSGVLVTHDWPAILRLCEEACELNAGKIVNKGASESVVCDYLQLATRLDDNPAAAFSESCPEEFHAISKQDWSAQIAVKIFRPESIFFNYSIEKLIPGQDWHILFLGEEFFVASETGNYSVTISIPELPLPPGDYRICLFLNSIEQNSAGSKSSCDIRSWTNGNSLNLKVTGEKQNGLVCMPMLQELNNDQ